MLYAISIRVQNPKTIVGPMYYHMQSYEKDGRLLQERSIGDNDGEPEHFIGRLGLTVGHEQGALSSITSVIAKNHGNITNLRFTNRTQDFFEMLIDIDVVDVKHLTNIIAALRATPVVNAVERARG